MVIPLFSILLTGDTRITFRKKKKILLNISTVSNRRLRVVQGYTSEPRTISCGVPQGSILGPLLFLIYINDLPACLKYATARMFADDTTITNSHKSTARLHREVNHDLNNLQNWLLANQLSLNVLKTESCILPLIITYLILESSR